MEFKELDTLLRFIDYDLVDELEKYVELNDLEEMGNLLITDTSDNKGEKIQYLEKYIRILNYLETETSIPTPVSDNIYDQIIELYKDLGGNHEISVTQSAKSSKKFAQHKYPELRGSLNKTHYVTNAEIPIKDSRKSIQQFLSVIYKDLTTANVSPVNITVEVDFKWDGVSHVFEMKKGLMIDKVLTRYDVDNNVGVDITHIFKNADLESLLFTALPKNSINVTFGLKVETFMPTEYYNRFTDDMDDHKCNRRSAITSIVNRGEDECDISMLKYLALKPLQISSDEYFKLTDDDTDWFYIGELFGHHQYISIYSKHLAFNVESIESFMNNIDKYPLREAIECIKTSANTVVPVDGAVITLLNQDIITTMGRSDNKNKFQVAFKFPQGVERTVLRDVLFPVGPVAGTITPLAIVDPVVINGNTITNATLSNFDKLERLDLNIGDEVVIKYDIIPKLEKTCTCKKGDGAKISRLSNCPICNSNLKGGNRCLNPECPAKLAGKIYNYIKKMKIKGIGKETILKFIERGYLTCIGDLYRLPSHKDEIVSLPSFGDTSFIKIISGIYSKTKIYPHEFLGAIGIPDVSTKTMKKLCESIPEIITMTECQLEESLPRMVEINGIGNITANKIIIGIVEKLDTVDDVIKYLEFKQYPSEISKPNKIVLFTGCRDHEFAEYLESKNIEVASNYVNSLTTLIVPDDMDTTNTSNKKVQRAKDNNIEILTLSEAKNKL